ncbi:MAG: hypothetical protein KC933_29340 [Myxococcales bacterium]|nr:hypothetical protein [Myxococcales bacterium]
MSEQTKPSVLSVVAMGMLAFLIIGSYDLARPAAESMFLKAYGSKSLPYVWLAVAAAAAGVVALYGRFAKDRSLLAVMAVVSLISAALAAVLLLGLRAHVPGAPFLLYVFKDVYVVVLIEIFWSYANSVFPIRTARWIYGLFCVMGSGGGALMNLVSGRIAAASTGTAFAQALVGRSDEGSGTLVALSALVPMLMVLAVAATVAAKVAPRVARPDKQDADKSYTEGLRLVRASRYLTLMLALIALSQLTITLVDYQFNAGIELYEADTDRRTTLMGYVAASYNIGAVLLQLGTGVIITLLGVRRVLPSIPGILGATLLAFLVAPHVALLAAAKVLSKVLDYSLFRATKELLYIPLTYAEKTQGKAVIDMLTYRVAKGGASLLLLAVVALDTPRVVGWLTLGVIATWVFVSVGLARRYTGESA